MLRDDPKLIDKAVHTIQMLAVDGVVKQFNLEAPGKFEVSSAEHMLKHLS